MKLINFIKSIYEFLKFVEEKKLEYMEKSSWGKF